MPYNKHIATACLISLASCTTIEPQRGFDDVKQVVAERIQQQVHWKNGSAEDQLVAAKVRELLQRPMAVEDAIQVALLTSPKLLATYENLGIAQASLVQEGLISNPVLNLAARYPREGDGQSEFDLDISQDFLSIITRSMRKSIAESAFEAMRLMVTGAVLDHAQAVRQAFYSMQMAEQTKEMMEQVVLSTEASLDVANALHALGNLTTLMCDQYRNMHEETLLMLADAEEAAFMSREKINRLLGLWGTATQWTVANRLPEPPAGVDDTQHVERRAIARSLDLAIIRFEMEKIGKQLGLTNTTAFLPELNFGFSSEREDGEWDDGAALGLEIPIFDYGQAKRASLRAKFRQKQREYVDLAITIRSSARVAAIAIMHAYNKVKHYENVLLPLRQRILNGAQLEYNGMQIGVFKLLMARKKQIDTGREYIMRLRKYWMAKANLEQILNGRLIDTAMPEMAMMNDDNAGEH